MRCIPKDMYCAPRSRGERRPAPMISPSSVTSRQARLSAAAGTSCTCRTPLRCWGGDRGMVYFFASQPIAADRCAGYVVIGRNYNFDQSDQVIRDFEDTIFGQDQRVVESQRPERVPFDLAAELHLKFDAVAVAYRKAMRANGLAADVPIGIDASTPG